MKESVTAAKILPLLLCYAQDAEPVHGRTRMQKMLFLFEQVTNKSWYQFQAANFGPFSWRLSSILDKLVSSGLVRETKEPVGDVAEMYKYAITGDGVRSVVEAIRTDPVYTRHFETMNTLKAKYNNMSLPRLLRFIYSAFPEYAVNSEYEFQY